MSPEQILKEELITLEKYTKVNQTKSLEELAKVIESFADENGQIEGNSALHDVDKMVEVCNLLKFVDLEGDVRKVYSNLTRRYGIRQQAIYLKTYQR